MTQDELKVILTGKPNDIIKALQEKTVVVPKWSDLVKEYDPMLHKIWDTTIYPKKPDDKNKDDFKRTALALQKLAVNRVAQSMFSTPVKRIYTYDRDNESEKEAVDLFEELYKTKVSIDSINIERAKKLNASCQIVSIWSAYEKPMQIGLEKSKLSLKCNLYSEMDGYSIFPITDRNGDILTMSIAWKDTAKNNWMAVYINNILEGTGKYYLYKKETEWIEELSVDLEIFPVLYMSIAEPVWGGDAGTNKVEQLEEMESYQGLYIKRNTVPTFTLDYGEVDASSEKSTTEEKSDQARRIIVLGKGGQMSDVTWEGAAKAVADRYERIRNAFFEEIQVPDTSFANMIKSNTSAENKELIFSDARAKAEDLGGEWEQMLLQEMEIIKKLASIMFSKIATPLEGITIRSEIIPYNVRTKTEIAEYISVAGDSMSLSTKVNLLGEVDSVEQEVEKIEEEQSTASNQF